MLGARQVGEPIVMGGGRVGHAELAVGGARLFLADAHPEIGVVAPTADGGATVSLHLEVADVEGTTTLAAEQGAVVERVPTDNPYGRIAVLRDPFGHRWMLNEPASAPAGSAESDRPGDVAYLTLGTPDSARFRAFYSAVLGWAFTPGHIPDGWQIGGVRPMAGMHGNRSRSPALRHHGGVHRRPGGAVLARRALRRPPQAAGARVTLLERRDVAGPDRVPDRRHRRDASGDRWGI